MVSEGFIYIRVMVTDNEYLLFLRLSVVQSVNGAVIIEIYQGKYDLDNSSEVKNVSELNGYQQLKDVKYFDLYGFIRVIFPEANDKPES